MLPSRFDIMLRARFTRADVLVREPVAHDRFAARPIAELGGIVVTVERERRELTWEDSNPLWARRPYAADLPVFADRYRVQLTPETIVTRPGCEAWLVGTPPPAPLPVVRIELHDGSIFDMKGHVMARALAVPRAVCPAVLCREWHRRTRVDDFHVPEQSALLEAYAGAEERAITLTLDDGRTLAA